MWSIPRFATRGRETAQIAVTPRLCPVRKINTAAEHRGPINTVGTRSPRKEESMRHIFCAVGLTTAFAMLSGVVTAVNAADDNRGHQNGHKGGDSIQLGPRPFYLIQGMDEGP